MVKTLRGTINGKTIELTEDPGLKPGEEIEIQVRTSAPVAPWGEGLRRCAGALANDWTEEDDRILADIYQDRKLPSRREIEE